MLKPRVSVCITTYNQDRYIKDCIMGVVAQQLDVELEVLIGDDGSTDATGDVLREIVDSVACVIKIFRHEKNIGSSENLQYLVGKATGDYIAHLDGDDLWMPGKLAAQVDFLNRNPECVAVYANGALIDDAKRMLGVFNRKIPDKFGREFLLEKGNFLHHSSIVYRGQYGKEILNMKTPFIDYQIHLRLAKFGKLGFLNEMLTAYRLNAVNSVMQKSGHIVSRLFEDAVVEELVTEKVCPGILRSVVFDWFVSSWFTIVRLGEVRKGVEKMKRVWSLAPASSLVLVLVALPGMVVRYYGLQYLKRICNGITGSTLYVYTRR